MPSLDSLVPPQHKPPKEARVSSNVVSYPQFVAGAKVIERNPLDVPISTLGSAAYSMNPDLATMKSKNIQSQIEERNYDLFNPDNQYLRYKQMMNSQYYNATANSQGFQQQMNQGLPDAWYGELAGDTKKKYEGVPATFKVSELAAKQKIEAAMAMRQTTAGRGMSSEPELDATQQRMLKPQTVSIYQLPQNPKQDPARPPKPEYYRSIQMNSQVKADVIEALGGIEDSISPLQKSLMQHEMRPFDLEPNYYEDLVANRSFLSSLAQAAKRGKSPAGELNELGGG